MDDKRYHELTAAAFRTIEAMLDPLDPDLVDYERAGDVVTITFGDGKKAVVNTQRPTHQIWLAANARAWHFRWDDATSRWLDEKGTGVELIGQIAAILKTGAGVDVAAP